MFIVLILLSIPGAFQRHVNCPSYLDSNAARGLSRFSLSEGLPNSYCSLNESLKIAIRDTSFENTRDIPVSVLRTLPAEIALSLDSDIVSAFSSDQVASAMQANSLGLVTKADLLSRKWDQREDMVGHMNQDRTTVKNVKQIKSDNPIWATHLIQTAILYQKSYEKSGDSECFWEDSIPLNTNFLEDLRIQNIEGVSLKMIDSFPKCGITFHLLAWGKLSEAAGLPHSKCRRIVSGAILKKMTSMLTEEDERTINVYKCFTPSEIPFVSNRAQVRKINDVRGLELPSYLGSEILYQNLEYLDDSKAEDYLGDFLKYTSIKELMLISSKYTDQYRSMSTDLILPFASLDNPFHASIAAFLYNPRQITSLRSLQFPGVYHPEFLLKSIRTNVEEAKRIFLKLNDAVMSLSQKRALLFGYLGDLDFKSIHESNAGLKERFFDELPPNLLSGFPTKVLARSSDLIFKQGNNVKDMLKNAAPAMSDIQKYQVYYLCKEIYDSNSCSQFYNLGLDYMNMMPHQDMASSFSVLRVNLFKDGTFNFNNRDLIEFKWRSSHSRAIVRELQGLLNNRAHLMLPKLLSSLGNLALGIDAEDILNVGAFQALDVVNAFKPKKLRESATKNLITPDNVRIFSKLLNSSFTEMFGRSNWQFTDLPVMFVEVLDGLILSQMSLDAWKSMEVEQIHPNEPENRMAAASLCRELVAKVSSSEFVDAMEVTKLENIANFYLLNCRYDSISPGLVESDIDILNSLLCYVDSSVLQETSSPLLQKHSHLLKNCCVRQNSSEALLQALFPKRNAINSELFVDQYRTLTSLGDAVYDIFGAKFSQYLNLSRDAVLEVYQHTETDKRIQKCDKVSGWSENDYKLALNSASELSSHFLDWTITARVDLCDSSSNYPNALTCTYLMGLAPHLDVIPKDRFANLASCELLRCAEFLGKAPYLTVEQKLQLNIRKSFPLDSLNDYFGFIPKFNRFGHLLVDVFSTEDIRDNIDFSDYDSFAELGAIDSWSYDQSRQFLESYIYQHYNSDDVLKAMDDISLFDLMVLNNFLCSLSQQELYRIDSAMLLSSIEVFGQLKCLSDSQKEFLLYQILSKYPKQRPDLFPPSLVSALGVLMSAIHHPSVKHFESDLVTRNNVAAIHPDAFAFMSEESFQRLVINNLEISDYLSVPHLKTIELHTKDSYIAERVRRMLCAEEPTVVYQYKLAPPSVETEVSDDIVDNEEFFDPEDAVEYRYSNIVYIYAGASTALSSLTLCLSVVSCLILLD